MILPQRIRLIPTPPPPVQTFNYYVDGTNGNDNNDGSAANPWKSIQGAIDYISDNIDACHQQIIVNVLAGTYGPVILKNVLGSTEEVVVGNTPLAGQFGLIVQPLGSANCTIDGAIGGPPARPCILARALRSGWLFKGFTLTTAGVVAVEADADGLVYLGNNTFAGTPSICIQSLYQSFVELMDAYTLQVPNLSIHWSAQQGGQIVWNGGAKTIALGVTTGSYFAWCDSGGIIQMNSNPYAPSFSGNYQGASYHVTTGGGILHSSHLPGDLSTSTLTPPGWTDTSP